MLGLEKVTQQPPLLGSPGGLAATGFRMKEFGVAACPGGWGWAWGWVTPTVLAPGAREGRHCWFRCGREGTLSSHPGSISFSYPRSHRGSARSRSPAIPALAPRATRSPCPGCTWREAESWAEVRARPVVPERGGVGVGTVREIALPHPWAGLGEPLLP